MNRLVVDGLRAGYGAVAVLHDISFEIREGAFVVVLGTNGNGKSTLLNTLVGLIRPTAGRMRLEWDGVTHDLARLPAHAIVNAGIAVVPEGRRLVPTLSVDENLMLAGSCPRGRKKIADNLQFCFDTFPLLAERRTQLAGTMSGGQQQVLAIARALMCDPRIMVIDEPSVGLAPIIVDQVFEAISTLRASKGLTILMAEQSFFQAVDVATHAYVIAHGRLVQSFDRADGEIDHDMLREAMMGLAAD